MCQYPVEKWGWARDRLFDDADDAQGAAVGLGTHTCMEQHLRTFVKEKAHCFSNFGQKCSVMID